MIKFVSADSQVKKASKAQNPYNNFYCNTHKCIWNIAHSILNQNMKKNNYFVITLQKVKQMNIMLFKNTAVSAFFISKSNIYCIN